MEEAKIPASDGWVNDGFGYAVAIDGDSVAVRIMRPSGTTSGGSAYFFTRQSDGWIQTAKLMASDIESDHDSGWSVAAAVGTIMIGAPGVNDDTGSVYAFSGIVFADVNGDGTGDIDDLFEVLANWT